MQKINYAEVRLRLNQFAGSYLQNCSLEVCLKISEDKKSIGDYKGSIM